MGMGGERRADGTIDWSKMIAILREAKPARYADQSDQDIADELEFLMRQAEQGT